MPIEELAKIIQEAWGDALEQKDFIIKATKNFTQPLPYITGNATSGIKIRFDQVDFSKGSIGTIYAKYRKLKYEKDIQS